MKNNEGKLLKLTSAFFYKSDIEPEVINLRETTVAIGIAGVLSGYHGAFSHTTGFKPIKELADKGKVERVNITATDTNSIKKCIASRFDGEIGLPLYYEGLGRAQADWFFGLNLTRALTLIGQSKGLDGVLTAGRVQSAALNIIVCREAEIASFTSKNFYEVQFTMSSQQDCFKGNWLPPSDLLDVR